MPEEVRSNSREDRSMLLNEQELGFIKNFNGTNVYNWLWLKCNILNTIRDWDQKYIETELAIDTFNTEINEDFSFMICLANLKFLYELDKQMLIVEGYETNYHVGYKQLQFAKKRSDMLFSMREEIISEKGLNSRKKV